MSDKVVILYHHSAYIIYSAILQFNAEIFVPFVVISNLGAIIYYVALKRRSTHLRSSWPPQWGLSFRLPVFIRPISNLRVHSILLKKDDHILIDL